MRQHEASRTLVKSPPELWAECSDAAALARHLGGFGEIRITRLDPETAVAWEGEQVRGTVRIEPAGWGTKVILTAEQAVDGATPPETPAQTDTPAPTETPVSVDPPIRGEPPVPVEDAVSVGPPVPVEEPDADDVEVDPGEPSEPPPESAPARRRRFARLRAFLRGPQPVGPVPGAAEPDPPTVEVPPDPAPAERELASPTEPEPAPTAESVGEPSATAVPDAEAALAAALDSLGQAHHRPYSRA
jgi:hypothetical protein